MTIQFIRFVFYSKLNNENALRNPHEFDNVAPAKDSNFLMWIDPCVHVKYSNKMLTKWHQ